MQFPYMAVLAAGVVAFVFGAVWYMSLGKAWQRAQGLDPNNCKPGKMAIAPMAASFLGVIVMAAVVGILLQGMGVEGWMRGAQVGLTLGIGLLLPSVIVNNMFQQKKPLLSVIDGAHWVLVLTLEGAVLGAML